MKLSTLLNHVDSDIKMAEEARENRDERRFQAYTTASLEHLSEICQLLLSDIEELSAKTSKPLIEAKKLSQSS